MNKLIHIIFNKRFSFLMLTSLIFSCNELNSAAYSEIQSYNASNDNEKRVLLWQCHEICCYYSEKFSGYGGIGSSSHRNCLIRAVSSYLEGEGTRAAQQLLQELRSDNFKSFLSRYGCR